MTSGQDAMTEMKSIKVNGAGRGPASRTGEVVNRSGPQSQNTRRNRMIRYDQNATFQLTSPCSRNRDLLAYIKPVFTLDQPMNNGWRAVLSSRTFLTAVLVSIPWNEGPRLPY